MPLYEFRCRACGESVDKVLRYAEVAAPGPCPACDGELARRYSRIGVRLNGWGFSGTDALVADRPDRGAYREVAERAERISEGE